MMKKKRRFKSRIPVPSPFSSIFQKLLMCFFIFIIDTIIDIFNFPNSVFNLLSNFNFNTCCIYGNKD